jgi:uncharacterized protein (DUF1778 family)
MRTTTIQLRVSEDEKKNIEKKAIAFGMTVSEFIRYTTNPSI